MNNASDPNSELDNALTAPDVPGNVDASAQGKGVEIMEPRPSNSAADGSFPGTHSFLLGVKLTVSVEVGRVQLPVREVLDLGPGSLIELQRSTAEPVEMYANGRCIGKGEIVVIGDQFGVRVTELGAAA